MLSGRERYLLSADAGVTQPITSAVLLGVVTVSGNGRCLLRR